MMDILQISSLDVMCPLSSNMAIGKELKGSKYVEVENAEGSLIKLLIAFDLILTLAFEQWEYLHCLVDGSAKSHQQRQKDKMYYTDCP